MELRGASSNFGERLHALVAGLPEVLAPESVKPDKPAVTTKQAQTRLDASTASELVRQYVDGKTLVDLAKIFGVNRKTVALHLERAGVPQRQRGLSDDQVKDAVRRYCVDGWSLQQIGTQYGVDAHTVQRVLKLQGIARRSPWEKA